MLTLQPELRDAISETLAGEHPSRWTRAAQELSERYRAPRGGEDLRITTPLQALGYAALVMPATYAQLHGAMAAAAARIPGWAPTALLDLGSGPGTALWAAAEIWPSLRVAIAVERSAPLLSLGRALARRSGAPAVRDARWERADLTAGGKQGLALDARRSAFDLVVLGHVLNELAPGERDAVVTAAWELTGGLLLIVEPGTAVAFDVVRSARDRLLAAGARTIAPCAHDMPCPLAKDWCHFPQRLRRPDFQRRARGAPSEWEDAKFAYAAMARFGQERPIWGRVIREPAWNKAYAEAKISAVDGVARYRGLKRHRDAFRQVKSLAWGAALDAPLPEQIAPVDRDEMEERESPWEGSTLP